MIPTICNWMYPMIIYIPREMTETKHKTMWHTLYWSLVVFRVLCIYFPVETWECVTPSVCCVAKALHCLSVLGIVFPPNAALYWLCEFLNRNWPNSLQEFRSLLQIMGQFGEIYWAHICPPDPRNISTSKIKFYPMSSMAWKSICEIRMSIATKLTDKIGV